MPLIKTMTTPSRTPTKETTSLKTIRRISKTPRILMKQLTIRNINLPRLTMVCGNPW